MHSNLLLCRSHTPLRSSPSPLSFFTPAPSSSTTLFSPSLLPSSIFTIHPHQSSASFLLSPLRPTPSILCSPHPPPSSLHPPSIRQQTGNAAGSDWRFHCQTLTVSVFIIQVIAQMAAAHSCICIFMGSELGHWQEFFFGRS